MKNKQSKRGIIIALVPLFVLCMIVFVYTVPRTFTNSGYGVNYGVPSYQNEYSSQEHKPEKPSHDPVYLSIFKFIVNCNPFKKEASI